MVRKSRLIIAEQSAVGIGGHYFAYTACIAQAAREADLDVKILSNYALKTHWDLEGISVEPAFYLSWSEAERQVIRGWQKGNIAHDFANAVAGEELSSIDHILFPTLGKVDLENLLQYLLLLPSNSSHPNYHVILRYDVSEIVPLMDTFAPIFRKISRSKIGNYVHFHTDTDLLSADYSKLTGVPFSTAPIPFNQTALRESVTKKLYEEKSSGALSYKKSIVYLGDARLEKNFHAIPDAASALWEAGLSDAAVFQLQCNFNCEGGEPGQMTAVQKLGQFPGSFVQLMPEALSDSEYYDLLAGADIVLIPYDADRYRSRSSGVLVEAMAAGKPVVTTQGSWMEAFVPADQAAIIARPGELGAALIGMIRDFDRYKGAAEQRAPAMRDWSSGANFIRHLLSFQTGSDISCDTLGPHALVVMNGNAAVLRNGASRVAEAQLGYLARQGYSVTGLFIGRPDRSGLEFSRDLLEATRDLPLDRAFLCSPPLASLNLTRIEAAMDHKTQSIAHDLEVSRSYQFDNELLDTIRAQPPEFVLLNYVTNYGIVESLGLQDTPVICEMHDIQSFQKAIYGNRPISQSDLDLEFSYLAKCNGLISLSPSETQYVGERLPESACVTTGVQVPVAPIDYRTIAGCESSADVVRLADPGKFGRISYVGNGGGGLGDVLRQIDEFPTIDLLFVSSNHKANAVGLHEFLKDVYIPKLAPLGISFLVAGSIDTMGPWPEHPLLTFVGRVENLDALYAAARLVVLPISAGAGSPVKTFEAISYRRPVVASSLALRGFAQHASRIAATPIADFAKAIFELLSDAEARRGARAAMHDYLVEARSAVKFDQAMNEILATATTITPPHNTETGPVSEDVAVPPLSHVEWSPHVGCISRIIRGLVMTGAAPASLFAHLAREDRDDVAQIAGQMLDALIVRQDAPLLSIESDLARTCRTLSGDREAYAELILRYLMGQIEEMDTESELESQPVIILHGDSAPIHIRAQPLRTSASPRLQLANEELPATRSTDGRVVWTLATDRRNKEGANFLPLMLGASWQDCSWTISQTLSDIRQEDDGAILVPGLGLTAGDLLVLELELWDAPKEGHLLGCQIEGRWTDLTIDIRDGRSAYRTIVSPAILQDVGRFKLSLRTTDAKGHVMRIVPRVMTVHRVLHGRGAPIVRDLGQHSGMQLGTKLPNDFAVRAEVIARALEAGLAMDRSDLILVCNILAREGRLGGLERKTAARLRRLLSEIKVQQDGQSLILSPLLPLIVASGGAETGHRRDWKTPLREAGSGWSIRLCSELLSPPPLGIAHSERYEPSGLLDEHLYRWSVPIALPSGVHLSIELEEDGSDLSPSDFAVTANGRPLNIEGVEHSEPGFVTVTAGPTGHGDGLPALEILLYLLHNDARMRAGRRAPTILALTLRAEPGAQT